MENKTNIREKLMLLIILAIAAGFLFLLPQSNSKDKQLSQSTPKLGDNTNNDTLDCIDQNSEISTILDDQQANIAPNSCLYIGCSGLSY